ncbi:MAG TPA: protein kinase [Tepidisphaeraceae bacterium]|nr:protein kinase [Tepidisphaeraceae bacterium]
MADSDHVTSAAPAGVLGESTAESPPTPPQLRRDQPETIGGFRIIEVIGEGGMGIVYRAEQREPVRRIVALKVIKLGMDTREVVARFEAERQALALMNHPNVAKVFDAGMTETGRPYFAMEHVPGVGLTEYCDTNKLTIRQRLELFISVCNAIQHAHQKGIIHRDLKPNNILVTLFDGKPVPKVIDFGIAKATNQKLAEHTLYTQTGALIGTPEYMSPEQAQTSGLDVDTRTDVYSLGVILYELLTGAVPFDHESLYRAGPDGMARMIREEEPEKPSTKLAALRKTPTPRADADSADKLARLRRCDFRTLQRELRGELDWIVIKAIEKDRTRRYESASALAGDVERYLNHEPVLAGPPSTLYRFVKFARRNRGWFAAVSGVSAALIIGFLVAVIGLVRAGVANSQLRSMILEARQARDDARRERNTAQAQKEEADRQRAMAQLALADGTLSQADALDMAGHWTDAGAKYRDAYSALQKLRRSTLPAELGLWQHYRNSPPPLLTFSGNGGAVRAVAVSRDGRLAVSGGEDHLVRLWDTRTGTEIRSFSGHHGAVLCVAISDDAKNALSGGDDKTLRLWDLQSGELLRKFDSPSGMVNCVAFSPDQLTALSGGEDGTLSLWDLHTGQIIRTLAGPKQNVLSVAFSPDGTRALSGGADKTLRLWDLKSGSPIRTYTGHTSWISSVAFSPDGTRALSGSDDQTVRLWNVQKGEELATFRGHSRRVSSVAFSADGTRILSASDDGTLKWWDVKTASEIRTLHGHTGRVLAAAMLPDNHAAISGGDDKTLRLWNLSDSNELRPLVGHTMYGSCLAFSSDGRLALSGGYDNTVRLWDVATGVNLETFTGHNGAVLSVAFSPDGRMAASASADQTIELWDIATGTEIRPLTGHSGAVQSIAFSPDGQSILSASADQTIKLWDLRSGKEIRTFNGTSGVVTSIAFSPDGRTALSGGEDQLVRLWDVRTGTLIHSFAGHHGRVLGVAFAPDGARAISAGEDRTIKLWDLQERALIRTFIGHAAPVLAIAFSPDGGTILSGGEDHTLRIWDVQTGNLLRSFGDRPGAVLGLAVAPDGYTVLTANNQEHTLDLWDFGRAERYLHFAPLVAKAQEALQQDPHDPSAAAQLGRWYAFRGLNAWAAEFLTAARANGAEVSPLLLARCYWRDGRTADAAREFRAASQNARDEQERYYLSLCLKALRR